MTHRMMTLMIELGLIILAARLGGMLFQHLKLPGVLGELCAGMLLGPYLLGGISLPGFEHGLFPVAGVFPLSPELYGICTFAVIILLFMAGLETDLKLFFRFSLAGILVGLGGVIGSFLMGNVITILFSPLIFGEQLGFFDAPCMFMGVLATPTSVGITARVLSEKRKIDSPEGVTILAGAVIDDVMGIILLAVVLGVIEASKVHGAVNWGHIGGIALKAVGIWLAATVLGLIFAKRISALLKWFQDKTAIAIMAFGLALIVAGLFEEAGLAMIIGAYVAGLSLSQTDISRVIQEKLDPVYRLMVPIFFCAMGMLVDFRAITSWPVLAFGGAYAAVAVLSKIAGCSLPAFFCNFNARGAARIGAGMTPRGEVALTMAGIGVATGVIGAQSFGVAVMMAMITTLLAPVLLLAFFNNPTSGTRRDVKDEEGATVKYEFPSDEIADLMINKVNNAFAEEGFYIHSLEHDKHNIFQLRQNDIVITLHRSNSDIIFNCARCDKHLINAAVYEVLAEFRQMVSQLNKPIDEKLIESRLQESGHGDKSRMMDLSDYVKPALVIPNILADTKEGVIEELLDILYKNKLLKDRKKTLKSLLDREKVISTGMQYGVAFPHAKIEGIDHIVCAVGLKRDGIDFGSIDGEPSRVFVLELAPLHAIGPHLQFMSTISQVMTEENCAKLLNGKKSAKAISDIMTSQG